MFTSHLSKSELRQGDLIQGMYYPILESSKIPLLGTPIKDEDGRLQVNKIQKNNLNLLTAQLSVFCGFSIVITQCCDLALREGKLMIPSFVIAPLSEIPYLIRTNPEKLNKLKENAPDSFINLFYIPPVPPLTIEQVVDFNSLISVPRSEYDHAISSKVLQLDDKERIKLKIKIAHNFGRPTQEERDAGIYQ